MYRGEEEWNKEFLMGGVCMFIRILSLINLVKSRREWLYFFYFLKIERSYK